MKKYIVPEIEIEMLSLTDVMVVSNAPQKDEDGNWNQDDIF